MLNHAQLPCLSARQSKLTTRRLGKMVFLFIVTLSMPVLQASKTGTRLEVWERHLLHPNTSEAFKQLKLEEYKRIKPEGAADSKEIRKDAERWLPFGMNAPERVAEIMNVLKTYTHVTKKKCVQGMTFVVCILHSVFKDEAKTFWAFHELLETRGLYEKIWDTNATDPNYISNLIQNVPDLLTHCGWGYITCGFNSQRNVRKGSMGFSEKKITLKVWDRIISKPGDGFDFMIDFTTELLLIATRHLSDDDPLPPGWVSIVDPESGKTYYGNSTTGVPVTQWEHPMPGYLYANQLQFTDEEYQRAFDACAPRRNKFRCQMPGCGKWLIFSKRHHCRRCGKSICGPCSRFFLPRQKEDRFCKQCSGETA